MGDDRARLTASRLKVLDVMKDGAWRTLPALAVEVGLRNPSTAASQLRDVMASGGWGYEKRSTKTPGIYEYRLFPIGNDQLQLI